MKDGPDKPALRRILYVEDDLDIQHIVQLALQSIAGYQVDLCGSAREAMDRAPVFRPDLILMDVMMPDMDGVELLQALRQRPETDSIPVIFLTAKVQGRDLAQYRRLGALDVIVKPFDPMRLPEDIARAWTRYHEGRQR